jgi:predicted ATPase
VVAAGVPDSLRQLIVQQLERLEPVDQALLETASVAGMVFSAATVAAGMETTVLEAEQRCGALAGQHQFVQACGTATWPDGTLAAQYGFRHAFYHEVCYERELGEQLDTLAQCEDASTFRLEAHDALGTTLFYLGDYAAARAHFEQGIALIDPAAERALALRHDEAPGVVCLAFGANTLWCLGYPAQAVRRSQEALALAQALAHPASLALAHYWAAFLHYRRREVSAVQAHADTLLTLATAQGFPLWVGLGTCWRGWVLTMQGQSEAGLAQLRQGLAAVLATGQTLSQICLILLAEAAEHAGQVEEGLRLLAEALTALKASARGDLLAETYRLQGEWLLQQAVPHTVQAEACFQQALALARRQQAKSWELRAAMSLSRLWQQQGKRAEARALLAPIYGWFTEGFDTADLQEAKALLEG